MNNRPDREMSKKSAEFPLDILCEWSVSGAVEPVPLTETSAPLPPPAPACLRGVVVVQRVGTPQL
jgi:hypothetical protein